MEISSKKFQLIIYTLSWMCILSAYPYIFTQFLPIPPLSVLCTLIIFFLFSFISLYHIKLRSFNKSFNYIVFTQIIGWLIYIFIHRDILYIERLVYIVVIYFLVLCLYNTKGSLNQFFINYDKFIAFMAIGGAICFFLVLIFNFQPLFSFHNIDHREASFFGLTSTNAIRGNIIRFAGYFDEPGAMAYWGIWALIYNKLFFKNNVIEKILIICLIFTFSMAYYIQIFIYYCLYKIKNAKQLIIMCGTIAIVVIGGYNVSQRVPFLYTLTFARFELSETGELKGDNRSELAEKAKYQFQKSPVFGNGITKISQMEYMADNPFETLAIDGIAGTLITYIPFIYLFFKRNKQLKYALIILFIGFLQRPFHHWLIFYFMTYSFFLLSNEKISISKKLCL